MFKEVDKEFTALIRDLLALGEVTQSKTLYVKEWEREGTKLTLESRGVLALEVDVNVDV